jgi:hypothetical protein
MNSSAAPTRPSFWWETKQYVGRVAEFDRGDWARYIAWVGLMLGLLVSLSGFVFFGASVGAEFPAYVWNVPLGTAIFVIAIAFDTIGHRTIYRAELEKGEALVHHVTIFAGISSCVMLCLAYGHRELFGIPAAVLVILSIFYSVIDEAMHWRRYLLGYSDRVEMWSHFFIFLGRISRSRWHAGGLGARHAVGVRSGQ